MVNEVDTTRLFPSEGQFSDRDQADGNSSWTGGPSEDNMLDLSIQLILLGHAVVVTVWFQSNYIQLFPKKDGFFKV